MKRLTVLLAAMILAVGFAAPSAQASNPAEFGIASASAVLSSHGAGAHPDFTTTIEMKTDPASSADSKGLKKPYGRTRDVKVLLPPGLLANLNAVDTCSTAQFVTALLFHQGCPFASQVGVAVVGTYGLNSFVTVPIYNVETTGDDAVARLGFYVIGVPAFIEAHVRSEDPGDYGVTAEVVGISSVQSLVTVTTTLWGVPADASHNTQRLAIDPNTGLYETSSPPSRTSGRAPAPFMVNPTTCGKMLQVGFEADSYDEPGLFHQVTAPLGEIDECGKVGFEPSFSLTPTNREAAAASGADATLSLVQNEAVNGRATSELRNTVVKLPRGLAIAAGAADGLEACSEVQVGYKVSPPPPAHCPEASKIAGVEIDSPALSRPVQGAVYQRTPEPGRLTRAWLVADELGVHVKLPGEFLLDPLTGQITSLFLETPQVPVRRFTLHFKGGARGVLATPSSCGTYQTAFAFSPWSGGADTVGQTPMTFDSHCNTGGFAPKLSAGTVNPAAGRFSPFVTNLTGESGEQNLSGLSISLPKGVLAKLAGVAVCSEAQAATGSCPASSQVGTTTVATGPGPSPLWIPQPGKDPTAVYLAGPYKGGPYSLVVKTPAQAGPFDLGTVVVRAAIHVDPETAQVSVASDPLPQFLEGIPVTYRTVQVDVNRPGFTLNPTSCARMQVEGTAVSASGGRAALSTPFQVGGCSSLAFKPKLGLRLRGGTSRTGHPSLRAVLTMPEGGANIASASVALPHSEFLDQGHIKTICTRVQFAAGSCPAGSVYGHARALTPLLDQPLEGPVYLRSSNHALPDLVADLNGQIHVVLAGRIDSVKGGIRTTFEAVPDAPVSKFVLQMQGGKKGLLINSTNLCTRPNRATVRLGGQNGKPFASRPAVQAGCKKKHGKGNGKKPKRTQGGPKSGR
jgi:hypothetical protein